MWNKLFKRDALLPEETIEWLFQGFSWALQRYGSDVFYRDAVLVEPTNHFFPGKGESIEEMATLILSHVKRHAGLDYLPCRVVNHREFGQSPLALANMQQVIQGLQTGDGTALTMLYEPQQVGNPNAMVANYAHALAYHLGSMVDAPAHCDETQWPHLMELLAVYMGFGIMFVNTARPKVIAGCGSCGNPAMERKGAMDELEIVYTLAIFCVLKDIPARQASVHLKSHLKPLLKKAINDVSERKTWLTRLREIDSPSRMFGQSMIRQAEPGLGQ